MYLPSSLGGRGLKILEKYLLGGGGFYFGGELYCWLLGEEWGCSRNVEGKFKIA